MNDSLARVLRTIAQLVAGGALTVVYDQLVHSLDPKWAGVAALIFTMIVSICQNFVEERTGTGLMRQSSPPAAKAADPIAKV